MKNRSQDSPAKRALQMMQRGFCLFFVFVLASTALLGQSSVNIGSFQADEHGGQVLISWQLLAGNTCNGIYIYRSLDRVNFTQIGSIPGLCGQIDRAVSYSFSDSEPVKNKVNYYRLELGNSVFSEIIQIRVLVNKTGNFQLSSNPLTSFGNIYINNDFGQKFHLYLHDSHGRLVKQLDTEEDSFPLDASEFSSGAYYFRISNEDGIVYARDKFFIIH